MAVAVVVAVVVVVGSREIEEGVGGAGLVGLLEILGGVSRLHLDVWHGGAGLRGTGGEEGVLEGQEPDCVGQQRSPRYPPLARVDCAEGGGLVRVTTAGKSWN